MKWALSEEVRYLYDGRRVIQERNSGNTPTVSYTRGRDLSGSVEGAGGIGGLLGRSHGYSGGNWSTHNHYHADGGGNITYLVNSSQGEAASYRYDPYGRLMGSSGTLAAANVYRFSSKELHAKSGMYGYGFRFYDPHLQRWLNRDPIFEAGGINLYGFNESDPANRLDPWGLAPQLDVIIYDPTTGQSQCYYTPDYPAPRAPYRTPHNDIAGGLGDLWRFLNPPMPEDTVYGVVDFGPFSLGPGKGGGMGRSFKKPRVGPQPAQKAAERMAKDMARRIERDLGKEARREFHDLKDIADRTPQELKEHAKAIYDEYGPKFGKKCPGWMSP